MENLYRRLGESVTKWKFKVLNDEFLVTRIRLTALYTILSVIFLCAFSVVLYESLVSRLDDSVQQAVLDPGVRAVVANQTAAIIQNLILLGDLAVLVVVIFVGFFLTKKTLEPIHKAMERQTRFTADASHELRTPLAVMKTGIEVSLRRKSLSAESARETLAYALKEANLMIELSNNLLSVSKGHLSDIPLDKIYLPDILQKKIERLEHIAEVKNIELSLSGFVPKNKFIMGNDFMLSQAFYNLIHNAIVYTPDGGLVEIKYAVKKNKYVVTISDTGMGISEEDIPHIFQPFYRADNSHTGRGSGLGLAIVKSHIDFHRGSVAVQSEVGKGTKFIVTLPIFSA
jgi:signal transduction histidine kinase